MNFLAGFGLTTLLDQQLRGGTARVVNVASDSLRDTRRVKLRRRPRPATVGPDDLDELARLNPPAGFAPFTAYARAKLLTVVAGYALAREFDGDATVNAVHPGFVSTGIIQGLIPSPMRPLERLIRRALLTPEQGAAAALRLALDPAMTRVTGRYFVRDVDTPTPPESYDPELQDRLVAAAGRFLRSAG